MKDVGVVGQGGASPATLNSTRKQDMSDARAVDLSLPESTIIRVTRTSRILGVLVSGIALFSDGYNAQIIGYMQPLFSELYVDPTSSRTPLIILVIPMEFLQLSKRAYQTLT